jgi:hypothetical protein
VSERKPQLRSWSLARWRSPEGGPANGTDCAEPLPSCGFQAKIEIETVNVRYDSVAHALAFDFWCGGTVDLNVVHSTSVSSAGPTASRGIPGPFHVCHPLPWGHCPPRQSRGPGIAAHSYSGKASISARNTGGTRQRFDGFILDNPSNACISLCDNRQSHRKGQVASELKSSFSMRYCSSVPLSTR